MSSLLQKEDRGVLRFITAGSVDDGKSTLIGRLLFDSKGIFADQLDALSRSKHKRTQGDQIDLSLLTDGLEAEREQGITIDVAYRYFATPTRKFIIADTPGHEQYTRNMVTGASTADAAIILVDVTRVKAGELLTQTKRHSTIAKLLGIEHIIVAINKMDLAGFDQAVFTQIVTAYQDLAQKLGLQNVQFIPMSALAGDNVVTRSAQMPWYSGPTLLELLEGLPGRNQHPEGGLRFPVQAVLRTYPEGEENAAGTEVFGFRGYQGRIAAGVVRPGDTVTVLPAGTTATVYEVQIFEGPQVIGVPGQSVTILLKENVDVSRGDMLVTQPEAAPVSKNLVAELCWLDTEKFDPRRKYWLKHTTRTTYAKISGIDYKRDVHTLGEQGDATELGMNDIARVRLTLQQPIVADAYADNSTTGSFILIDATTHQTAAAGMIVASS